MYVLSERDYLRIQKMLRWFEHGTLGPKYRRRSGAAGGAGVRTTRLFRLTAVATDLTGIEQTAQAGVFSDKGNVDEVTIYVFPQIDTSHYQSGDKIFATKVGDSWVAHYSQPCAWVEYS